MHMAHQPQLCLTGNNSICRLCMFVYGGILQPLGKQSSSTHCRETSPAVISGFFIYYAVRYYIKGCLLSFSFFFFTFFFLFLHPTSLLLVLSLSGRIIRNPLGKALISPSSFQTCTHTHIGLRGSLGTSVYSFPRTASKLTRSVFSH